MKLHKIGLGAATTVAAGLLVVGGVTPAGAAASYRVLGAGDAARVHLTVSVDLATVTRETRPAGMRPGN